MHARPWAWLAGMALVAGCSANDPHPLRIVQFQQLDDTCTAPVTAPPREAGVLDLQHADQYVGHMRVERTDPGGGNIWAVGVNVEVSLPPSLRDGSTSAAEADAASAWRHPIDAVAIETEAVVSAPLLSAELVEIVRRGLVGADSVELGTATVTVSLEAAGAIDGVASAPAHLDVRLCASCLLAVVGDCPDDPNDPSHPSTLPPACVFGQDDLLRCCQGADGALLCQAASVPPDCTVTGCPEGFDCYDCWGDFVCNDGSFVC